MILPQQLQMLKINGEPDDQRRRREKQVLDNYKTERELLELRAQSHEEKYKRLDEEMISIISEKAMGRCEDILVTLWYEETKKEQKISEKRWKSKNEVWLKTYEADVCIKYADKNPFIKESEEIGIYRQTYQGDKGKLAIHREGHEVRVLLTETTLTDCHATKKQQYKAGHFFQKSFKGEDKNKQGTTSVEAVTSLKIGQHIIGQQFRRNRRSQSRRPFYRGRLSDNAYARNRRYANDRRTGNQDVRGNFEYAGENRREEALPRETTNQYQGPFFRTGRSNNARTLASNPTANERSTKIINLSRKQLTDTEQKILEKGLKFTPTPEKENSQELKEDLFEFERKLRLAEYFFGTEDPDISIVRNESNFIPPKNRNASLENLQNTPTAKSHTNIRCNVSLAERNAIKSLTNDKSVVIKEADKGGAVVIMDSEHHKTMIKRVLLDEEYYQEISVDPQKSDRIKYKRFLNKYKDCLTEKEMDYLINFEMKSSNSYGLPKVHKSEKNKATCEQNISHYVDVHYVNDLKLRPIVAGSACQTHRLSNSLDILLRPLTKRVKSYLRDTIDFLNHLPSEISENTLLVHLMYSHYIQIFHINLVRKQ